MTSERAGPETGPDRMAFTRAPGVIWAGVSDGVWVGRLDGSDGEILPYPRAAAWDMLSRGRSFEHVIDVLVVLAPMERAEAEEFLQRLVLTWLHQGRLVREKAHG